MKTDKKKIAELAFQIFDEVFWKSFMEMLKEPGFADFSKGENLAVGRWGSNITIFDLECRKLFRVIPRTSEAAMVKEALLRENQRYPTIKHCIDEFLFESNWEMAGGFLELRKEDIQQLFNRLEKEGIELKQYLGAVS